MIILIGKRSRLTEAISQQLHDCLIVSTHDALTLKKFDNAKTIIICSAITNPRTTVEEIEEINVKLPISIFENNPTAEIVTFGTVLEKHKFVDNAYVASKRMLCHNMSSRAGYWKHYRLNTLYGIGEPKKHMFLSDLLRSIRSKSTFEMSSGYQMREYHHYYDLAAVLESELTTKKYGELEISSGSAISLYNLAKGVIEYLGIPIRIAVTQDMHDSIVTTNHQYQSSHIFRDPIAGVGNYFKSLI
tara:strand:+ start:75 stop:809 length:735 start_codon:yes stop_codon:yes gene_type:complete